MVALRQQQMVIRDREVKGPAMTYPRLAAGLPYLGTGQKGSAEEGVKLLESADCKRGRRKGATSKNVKNRQKVSKSFSTLFDNFRAGQKTSKIVKKCQKFFDTFQQFLSGTFFPAPFGAAPPFPGQFSSPKSPLSGTSDLLFLVETRQPCRGRVLGTVLDGFAPQEKKRKILVFWRAKKGEFRCQMMEACFVHRFVWRGPPVNFR